VKPPRPISPGRPPGFSYRPVKSTRKERSQSVSALHCDQVPVEKLAKRFGTPLYLYSATTIRQRQQIFDGAFGKNPHTICYSVKANSNLAILRLLAKRGCGFDVVSGGELQRVQRADRRASAKTVFSGVGKTQQEIQAALRAGILLFNVESESELEVLTVCAARLKKTARVAMRVNPDVSAETHPYISTGLHQHKFGVPIQQAAALYARAAKSRYLKPVGVSVHIGSQITDVAPFSAAMERVAALVRDLRADGHPIQYVDAGGGLAIDYQNPDPATFAAQAAAYAEALLGPLHGLGIHLLLEPGRSIVGPAGVLVARLIYKKTNNGKKFLVVDAAMNDLIRPSLYQAHHEIVPVVVDNGGPSESVDVVGPICETGDFFARDRMLQVIDEGSLLAILDTGAYGMVLASNYNTRPRAAEVLVDRTNVKVIRRRETINDLLRQET
jgi:diaminopimelate decarboxylase